MLPSKRRWDADKYRDEKNFREYENKLVEILRFAGHLPSVFSKILKNLEFEHFFEILAFEKRFEDEKLVDDFFNGIGWDIFLNKMKQTWNIYSQIPLLSVKNRNDFFKAIEIYEKVKYQMEPKLVMELPENEIRVRPKYPLSDHSLYVADTLLWKRTTYNGTDAWQCVELTKEDIFETLNKSDSISVPFPTYRVG